MIISGNRPAFYCHSSSKGELSGKTLILFYSCLLGISRRVVPIHIRPSGTHAPPSPFAPGSGFQYTSRSSQRAHWSSHCPFYCVTDRRRPAHYLRTSKVWVGLQRQGWGTDKSQPPLSDRLTERLTHNHVSTSLFQRTWTEVETTCCSLREGGRRDTHAYSPPQRRVRLLPRGSSASCMCRKHLSQGEPTWRTSIVCSEVLVSNPGHVPKSSIDLT